MIDTPKRRFWQIRLSTAVVLMLVAGAVLWLNFHWFNNAPDHALPRWRGWPAAAYVNGLSAKWINYDTAEVKWIEYTEWRPVSIIIDSIVGLVFIAVAGIVAELSIRRSERGRA